MQKYYQPINLYYEKVLAEMKDLIQPEFSNDRDKDSIMTIKIYGKHKN